MLKLLLEDIPNHVTIYPRTQEEVDKQVAEFERRFRQPAFALTMGTYTSAIAAKRGCAMKLTVFDFLLEQRSNGPSGYMARNAMPTILPAAPPKPAATPIAKEMSKEDAAKHLAPSEFALWLEMQRSEGKDV